MAELFFNLQMFAEGSAPAGNGAESGDNVGTPTTQGEQAATPTAPDRNELYAKFKDEFKDLYDAEVQNTVKDRLKKSKAEAQSYKEKLNNLSPLLETVATKYGVKADDYDGIIKALEADDKLYEDEAYQKGMTVEQVKEFHKLERENRMLRAQQEEEMMKAQWAEWDRQFNELKNIYPNADPQAELQNENFTRLMNAGVPIRDAFELVHKDELTRGAMQFAANKVAEKMTNAAMVNNSHPTENGMAKQAAAVTHPNIQSMSIEQLKEYAMKAKAGESVDFRNNY